METFKKALWILGIGVAVGVTMGLCLAPAGQSNPKKKLKKDVKRVSNSLNVLLDDIKQTLEAERIEKDRNIGV